MFDRFSGLCCRPGELAVIVQDEPECRDNIGQIVRVLRECTDFPDELGFNWLVEPLSCQPSPVLVVKPGQTHCSVVYDNANRAHYDGRLRPLLETQLSEEMTLLAALPTKCTAPAEFTTARSEWPNQAHALSLL